MFKVKRQRKAFDVRANPAKAMTTVLDDSQYIKANRLAKQVGPKRPGELRSEYARRLFLAQSR